MQYVIYASCLRTCLWNGFKNCPEDSSIYSSIRHSIYVLLHYLQEDIRSLVTHLSAPSCLSLRFHSSVQINYLPVSLTICVSPLCYRRPDQYRMHRMSSTIDPATVLLSITQDGRPIEYYVEEFLQLANQVPWNDGTLKVVFWTGLNDHLYLLAPAATTPGSLAQYIEYVLLLAGSPLTVGAIDEDDKGAPVPKTTPVEGISIPKSQSEMTVTKIIPNYTIRWFRRPRRRLCRYPRLLSSPQDPFLASALQCLLLAIALQCLLLASALLRLRWSRPALLSLRWSRPALLSLRWSRPALLRFRWSRPAPRFQSAPECPRFQSAPECPRFQSASKCLLFQSAHQIPSRGGRSPSLPNNFFWGGYIPVILVAIVAMLGTVVRATMAQPPWPPKLPDPPWPPKLPDPPWPPESPDPPWPSKLPAPPWPSGLHAPPWPSGLHPPPWPPDSPVPPWLLESPVPPWLPKSPVPPWMPPQYPCPPPTSRAPTPPPRWYCYGRGR